LPASDVLGRTIHAQVPLLLAAGALSDAEVIDATQQDGDPGLPAVGEIEVAMSQSVKHDRGDISGVSHVDRVVGGELIIPHLPAGGIAQRPEPGNRIPEEHQPWIGRGRDLAVDPAELTIPVIIQDLAGNPGAGGQWHLIPEMLCGLQ
jgi:hypothetical protein